MALRRRPSSLWPIVVAALVLLNLVQYSARRGSGFAQGSVFERSQDAQKVLGPPVHELPPEATISLDTATSYIKAILDEGSTALPRMACPNQDYSRYASLKPARFDYPHFLTKPSSKTPYFFALNLRNNMAILPRLLASVIQVIRFLGPENCALSIVEGNSPDGTADVLSLLEQYLDSRLRTFFVLRDSTNPKGDERFELLAKLRQKALEPMLAEPNRYRDATVAFINDVAICPDDILELLYQRKHLGADMTCAMDWNDLGGPNSTFYDIYISRSIKGDTFFNIPMTGGSWSESGNLFWNDPDTRARLDAYLPFQVFACWNGAVTFTAKPLVKRQVVFRKAQEGECHNGEPEIFCKDLWRKGYGKIAVVPSVNLAYADNVGQMLHDEKGTASQIVARTKHLNDLIEWQGPPEKVRCMPTFENPSYWVPWDDTNGKQDH